MRQVLATRHLHGAVDISDLNVYLAVSFVHMSRLWQNLTAQPDGSGASTSECESHSVIWAYITLHLAAKVSSMSAIWDYLSYHYSVSGSQ